MTTKLYDFPEKEMIRLPEFCPSSHIFRPSEIPSKFISLSLTVDRACGALKMVGDSSITFLEYVQGARHKEPEKHIDAVISGFLSKWLLLDGAHQRVIGLTDKDVSLVQGLSRKLKATGEILYPEICSIEAQDCVIRKGLPRKLADTILVVRHLLEHADDPKIFLDHIVRDIDFGSLCIFEVPDASSLFKDLDITQIWEEHRSYFSLESVQVLLKISGFEVLDTVQMNSEGEDVIILLARKEQALQESIAPRCVQGVAESLIAEISTKIQVIRKRLIDDSEAYAIILFGANHITSTFIDLCVDEGSLISGVWDDDQQKNGLCISRHAVPISSSYPVLPTRPLSILVAVAEGRAPSLYRRLKSRFPEEEGHKIRSLSSFVTDV